ncbi:MAG: hypothetical protein SGPRY_006998, partial [Prymnesium sp.]
DLVAAASGLHPNGEGSCEKMRSHGLRPEFTGLWRSVERIKGVVWFSECRSQRGEGAWQTRPQVELVFIGRLSKRDAARLLQALESVRSAPEPGVRREGGGEGCEPCEVERVVWTADERRAARLLIEMDARFELVQEEGGLGEGEGGLDEGLLAREGESGVVHFQLVGAALYGISREELEGFHRIDVNSLTASFVQRLNSHVSHDLILGSEPKMSPTFQAKPFMLGAPRERALSKEQRIANAKLAPLACPFTARFALGGTCRLDHVWPAVCQIADSTISQWFSRLQLCKCDM